MHVHKSEHTELTLDACMYNIHNHVYIALASIAGLTGQLIIIILYNTIIIIIIISLYHSLG